MGSEFDAFGADNLNLTKLLGSDTVGSPWGDPFADPTLPSTGGSAGGGSSANQREYPIRPWEMDLGGGVTSSLSSLTTSGQTMTTQSAPPNVLAPPSNTAGLHGLPRPPPHATAAAPQYFHPHAPAAPGHPVGPTYIDQRLPSFQSQFQVTADAATAAAAFHVPAPHYSSLGKMPICSGNITYTAQFF